MDNNTSKALEPASESLLTGDGTGSPLFVINLCASMAPVKVPGKALPGLENYRLYQVTRVEDGRTRYRLRLGFFSDENEAGMVLASVREQYPTAFTTCLCDEDKKFARGFTPAPVARAAAKKPSITVVPTPAAPAPKAAPAAVKAPAVAAPTAARPAEAAVINELPPVQPKREAEVIELTWMPEDKAAQPVAPVEPKRDEVRITPSASAADLKLEAEPVRTQAQPSAPTQSAQPFHVGKGAQIPDVKLEIAGDAKAASTPPIARAQQQSKPTTAAPTPARPAVTLSQRGLNMELPELDSTQTIRALTSSELNDETQEKWFSIQLAVSDQPVNLDAMPRLDIFEAYRLYSVATAGSGKITHSLRLGFFREAVSAEAVAGYLKTFFAEPTVIRVSVAEQIRFKEPPARKNTPPKSESNVITLNTRERNAAAVPTVTMEVTPKPDTGATGTFKANQTGSFKPNATGSFKAHNTGSFKAQSTGSFKANDTGSFKPGATGAHRAQVAAKSAVATRSSKTSSTGKFKATRKPSLQEQLLEEAREVELSESGIRKLPKSNSLLARLVGKLTK